MRNHHDLPNEVKQEIMYEASAFKDAKQGVVAKAYIEGWYGNPLDATYNGITLQGKNKRLYEDMHKKGVRLRIKKSKKAAVQNRRFSAA